MDYYCWEYCLGDKLMRTYVIMSSKGLEDLEVEADNVDFDCATGGACFTRRDPPKDEKDQWPDEYTVLLLPPKTFVCIRLKGVLDEIGVWPMEPEKLQPTGPVSPPMSPGRLAYTNAESGK
jgi:hypothetical protein